MVFLFSVVLASHASAQEYGYNKGDKLVNVGIGVKSYYSGGIPLSISYEQGITDQISVGAGVDYLSDKYKAGFVSYKFIALYFGARASYHVNELLNINNEKIDLYAGATAGYRTFTWKNSYSNGTLGDSYGNGFFFGGYIGAKYFLPPALGPLPSWGQVGLPTAG